MRKLILILIAVVEGFLLSLLLPNIEIGILPFIVLLPSYFLIKYAKTYKGAFFLGWITGFTLLCFSLNWITFPMALLGGVALPNWTIYPLFVLLCLIFSLKLPLIYLFTKIIDKNLEKIPLIAIFPIIFTAFDFIMFDLFPYDFGNMMHKDLLVMQIADITGVPGLSFLMALSSGVIFTFISYFFPRFTKTKRKRHFPYLIIASSVAIILLAHVYGYVRINEIEKIEKEVPNIKVGFIQPNTILAIEDFRNNSEYLDREIEENWVNYFQRKCVQLTLKILIENPDVELIVWPENSVPNLYLQNPQTANEIKYKDKLKNIAQGNALEDETSDEVYIFLNTYDEEIKYDMVKNEEVLMKYDNFDLISPDGKIVDSYRKVLLTPINGYRSIKSFISNDELPIIKNIMSGLGKTGYFSGNDPEVIQFGKWTFTPQSGCEALLPKFTRKFTKRNTDFIVNLTNNRWMGNNSDIIYGKGKASAQYFTLTLPRAIENRMYLINAVNSGISGVITSTGKKLPFESKSGEFTYSTNFYEQDYGIANIKPLNIKSIYKTYGDIFAWLIVFTGLVLIVVSIILNINYYIRYREHLKNSIEVGLLYNEDDDD